MAIKKKVRARITGKLVDYDWTGAAEMSGKDFHKHKNRGLRFYYENFKTADLHKNFFLWMKEHKYKKADIDAMKALPNGVIPVHISILAKCLLTGMPDSHPAWDEHWVSLAGTSDTPQPAPSSYIISVIDNNLERGRAELKAKTAEEQVKEVEAVVKPTIQDRIREQAALTWEEVEDWLEGFVEDSSKFDPKGFDFAKHFRQAGTTQAHARKMKTFFEGELAEMREVLALPTAAKISKIKDDHERDMTEQLSTGYSHLKKADVKKIVQALENLNGALDMIIEESKAKRKSPTRKPRTADKQVEKLKFKAKDERYQLVSVSPISIVGATELWVFNVKTRKLGKYVAASVDPKGLGRDGTGLGVKGTTIIGFDEVNSVQKTLRKPEEQLKEFKGSGKVKLRKFMEEIKTTDTKLNGRINADTVLLKVM